MTEAPVPASPVPAAPVTGSIVSARDLAVAYRTRRGAIPALRGINLDVASGESYGLVGQSSPGKSTAALALTRYLPPGTEVAAAELSVADTSVLGLSADALRAFRAASWRWSTRSRGWR